MRFGSFPNSAGIFAVAMFVLFPQNAAAISGPTEGRSTATIITSQPVRAPMAHIRFCAQNPDQCTRIGEQGIQQRSERQLQAMLERINRQVNASIVPTPDKMDRGLQDVWQVNVAKGDCEDYALQKRKMLLTQGWPSERLRIAVVFTREGISHAVLVARVGQTDYVLDNLVGELRPWNYTGYSFIKIQSPQDPKLWLEVGV